MYRYDKEEIRHSIAFIQDPSRMHGVAYGTRKLTLSNGRQVEVYNDYVKAGGGGRWGWGGEWGAMGETHFHNIQQSAGELVFRTRRRPYRQANYRNHPTLAALNTLTTLALTTLTTLTPLTTLTIN